MNSIHFYYRDAAYLRFAEAKVALIK